MDFFSCFFYRIPHYHSLVKCLTIFLAYTLIPFILLFFIFIRKDFPFQTIFILFTAFIFLCGAGHLVEASIFWEPWYRLSALIKALTAIVSVCTVVALINFLPKILKLPRYINMQLKSVLENAPDSIIITNKNDIIEVYNPASEKLFQYSSQDMIGQNINLLIPSSENKTMKSYISSFQCNEKGGQKEVELQKQDKSIVSTQITSSDVEVENSKCKVYIIRDVSLRKEYERKLTKSNENLKKINKELDSFAYVASHDLKSPLRGIQSLSKFLYDDCYDLIPESSREHLKKIQGRVKIMEELLNSLLEYARIGREKLSPESVNCLSLVEEVIEEIEIPDNFTFTLPEDIPVIHTHKYLFRQVLQNLISNAIKYRSPEREGHVTIDTHDQGSSIEISINDNGQGIPKQYHDKVFQMFQRLHSNDEIEGSGIGLAVVKKIIESVGGRITLDPQKEVGTRVTFTWPKRIQGEAA